MGIRQVLLNEVNEKLKKTEIIETEFGVGVIGYDFVVPMGNYHLQLYYNAIYDALSIKYMEPNELLNNIDIRITINKEDIPSTVYDTIWNLAWDNLWREVYSDAAKGEDQSDDTIKLFTGSQN